MIQGSIDRAPTISTLYQGRGGVDPVAMALVAAITAMLLGPLLLYRALPEAAKPATPIAVVNLHAPPPPPPAASPPRSVVPTPPVAVHAPPPLVVTPALAPPPVVTQPEPAPLAPVVSNEPPAPVTGPPAPPRPVSAGDLSTSMIDAPPPRYPRESRRLREQGVVVLSVLLGADGRVADIGVARTSGHRRLDQAAVDAVRKWRWRPTIRQGIAVQVRGSVEIPFVLQGVSTD